MILPQVGRPCALATSPITPYTETGLPHIHGHLRTYNAEVHAHKQQTVKGTEDAARKQRPKETLQLATSQQATLAAEDHTNRDPAFRWQAWGTAVPGSVQHTREDHSQGRGWTYGICKSRETVGMPFLQASQDSVDSKTAT